MLNDVLMQAVDRMPKMAEHVYDVTLKQTIVDAWSFIVVILIIAVAFITALKYSYDKLLIYKKVNADNYHKLNNNPWEVVLAIGSILAAVLSIPGIIGIRECICTIINPEYAVLQKLIDFVK
jgi:hypothetical protein